MPMAVMCFGVSEPLRLSLGLSFFGFFIFCSFLSLVSLLSHHFSFMAHHDFDISHFGWYFLTFFNLLVFFNF